MSKVTFRVSSVTDAQNIAKMLSHLTDDLGDGGVFASTEETISRYGFGSTPMFDVILAEIDGEAVGFALFFPHFSTTKGQAGVYVQDLWVDPNVRGLEIGQKLLAEVARNAADKWNAGYMKLCVYADNPRAMRFYTRLGFCATSNDTSLILETDAFQIVKGAAA